jgi:glycosyltransferase involved in cell wall biosynthesis
VVRFQFGLIPFTVSLRAHVHWRSSDASLSMSTVSIVIPCHNLGAFIAETLASARAQTWRDTEIIVADDGSDDDETQAQLDSIARDEIRVVRIPHGGPSAARNAGIRASQGTYVFPLDADDLIDPTLIEKAVRIADDNADVGIVYSQIRFFGMMSGVWDLQAYRFPDILLGNLIPSAGLFRRTDWELVKGYDTEMVEGWEDYDFWLSLIELGRRVVQIPEPLFHYRRRPTSRSMDHQREALIRCYARLFRNHLDLYASNIETVIEHIVDLRTRLARCEASTSSEAPR